MSIHAQRSFEGRSLLEARQFLRSRGFKTSCNDVSLRLRFKHDSSMFFRFMLDLVRVTNFSIIIIILLLKLVINYFCAFGEMLLQEATGIRRTVRVYPVAINQCS